MAALASDKAGPAAVAAFGRILSGYARRACSWGELEGRLAGVPLQKVGGWPGSSNVRQAAGHAAVGAHCLEHAP